MMLAVSNLSVAYGKVEALHDVSLRVPAGAIVTVIGASGAGKTTLLGALMGLLPCSGQVRYEGRALDGLPVEARVPRGLALVPEQRELFGDLPVEDNLLLGAFHRRRRRREFAARPDHRPAARPGWRPPCPTIQPLQRRSACPLL